MSNMTTSERITAAALGHWLTPALNLPNAPTTANLGKACSVIMLAVHDLPAAVLNGETMKRALRTWRFWPTPAEVFAVLSEWQTEVYRERVLPIPPPKAEPPPRQKTEAERAAVSAMVKELTGELRAKAAASEAAYRAQRLELPRRPARQMTREELTAAYAARGLRAPWASGG